MGVVGKIGGRAMPPGFYYKTFMFPESMWMTYEKYIRTAAGLGKSPLERDPDRYETVNQHCDVLVVGAGPAGLMAARNLAAVAPGSLLPMSKRNLVVNYCRVEKRSIQRVRDVGCRCGQRISKLWRGNPATSRHS